MTLTSVSVIHDEPLWIHTLDPVNADAVGVRSQEVGGQWPVFCPVPVHARNRTFTEDFMKSCGRQRADVRRKWAIGLRRLNDALPHLLIVVAEDQFEAARPEDKRIA